MKNLKIGIFLLSIFAIVSFSNAQTDVKARNNNRIERIIVKLGLNEDQAKQARELNGKFKELISNAKDQQQKATYKKEAEAELKKILTPEQFVEYKKILANEKKSATSRSERMKEGVK